jgi:hypothetical protein
VQSQTVQCFTKMTVSVCDAFRSLRQGPRLKKASITNAENRLSALIDGLKGGQESSSSIEDGRSHACKR